MIVGRGTNLRLIGIACLLGTLISYSKALTSEEALLKPTLKLDSDLIEKAKSINWKEESKSWERKITLLDRLEIVSVLFDPSVELAKLHTALKEEYDEEEIDRLLPKRLEELKERLRISVVASSPGDYGADVQFDWENCFMLADDKGKQYEPIGVSQGGIEREEGKISREITVVFPSLLKILSKDTSFVKLIVSIPAGKAEFYWKFDQEYLKGL